MSRKIKRFMSTAAAAALSLTNIPFSTGCIARAAQSDYSGDDMISVIITLNSGALLESDAASGAGADFIGTGDAEKITGEIASAQEQVQDEIRSFFPELKVDYSYSVLLNGFSCELPESLIDDAEALPMVEQVTEIRSVALPQMTQAAELGGIPSYCSANGCTGKGQVIAVIDTELDITHPMFAPMNDDAEVKLTKEDIAEIAADAGLSMDIDPDKAYISNKLPFVVDYVADPYTGYMDHVTHSFHGTHVAGIAAGNEVDDGTGNKISGVAKDAQMIFMAASDGRSFKIDVALAAAEDAVKLRADVINMSVGVDGELYGSELYARAMKSADNAGITFCLAAGNNGDGYEQRGFYSTDEPDRSYINALSTVNSGALCVAAADTPADVERPVFIFDGKQIFHSEVIRSGGEKEDAFLKLSPGSYEYVYCGYGRKEEFQGIDLSGRIAVVDRGMNSFDEKAANAAAAGAAGIITINNEGCKLADLTTSWDGIPICLVKYSDGQLLINAENKEITVTDERAAEHTEPAVSTVSSWGVPLSLELRPDITGFGGNIKSAYYDGQFVYSSGTSMSTPYISGCAALLREYMDRQGTELSGPDKTRYIRNILMSSAVPFAEGDIYTSPRRQGAGLVSMENVAKDKVIITGASGESKLSLYDRLEDEFSFGVCLDNISSEAVDFSSARIVLSTDGYKTDPLTYNTIISGQTALSAEAELSGLLHIDPGEKRSESITVKLDPEQTAELAKVFSNGFFVEGYIFLEGAENCCDISIPLCGFHGDWCAEQVIISAVPCVNNGTAGILGGYSLAALAKLAGDVTAEIPAEERADIPDKASELFMKYSTNEQKIKIFSPVSEVYISPNGDGLADVFGLLLTNRRYAVFNNMKIYDEDGKCWSPEVVGSSGVSAKNTALGIAYTSEEVTTLPEGRYTGVISCDIGYGDREESLQKVSGDFIVDRTAPELKCSESERNGRRILTITASDSDLDGIIISGRGRGGIAGVYDPEADISPVSLEERMTMAARLIYTKYQVKNDASSADDLPLAGRCFCGTASAAELADNDFSDVIIAQPDENGIFTVEYDITDLSCLNVAAVDRAMNMTEAEAEEVKEGTVRQGIWSGTRGYFEFSGDMLTFMDFITGEKEQYTVVSEDGRLTLRDGSGIDAAEIKLYSDNSVRIGWNTGSSDKLRWVTEAEGFSFYSGKDIEKAVLEHLERTYMVSLSRSAVSADTSGTVAVKIWIFDVKGTEQYVGEYRVDNRTGSGTDVANREVNLFAGTFSGFRKGIWLFASGDDRSYIAMNDDGKTGRKYALHDGSSEDVSYLYDDHTVTLRIGTGEVKCQVTAVPGEPDSYRLSYNKNEIRIKLMYDTDPEEFSFFSDVKLAQMLHSFLASCGADEDIVRTEPFGDDQTMFIMSSGMMYAADHITAVCRDINGKDTDLKKAPAKGCLSAEELGRMAQMDILRRRGMLIADTKVERKADGSDVITMIDFTDEIADVYTIDPLTGKGTNSSGEAVDLPQTGISSPVAAAGAAAGMFLVTAGMTALFCSGALRRRKDAE